MEAEKLAVLIFASIAAGTDLCDGRIENRLTKTGCAAAAVLAVMSGKGAVAVDRLFGMVLPLVVLGWMFALGGIGGGDVKLFCVIGGFVGWRAVLKCMAAAAFAGAALGICSWLMFAVRFRRLPLQRTTIHFSVPILLGLWVYLEGWI